MRRVVHPWGFRGLTNVTDCRMEDLLAGADGLFAARRYELAAGCYRTALADDPAFVPAHLGLADCFAAMGGTEHAVAGLVSAAAAMRERGLFDGAGTLLARAVVLAPDQLDLHVDVAELELACGRKTDAQQRLEYLAHAYTERGQHEDAAAILEVIETWIDESFSRVVHTEVAPMQPPAFTPAQPQAATVTAPAIPPLLPVEPSELPAVGGTAPQIPPQLVPRATPQPRPEPKPRPTKKARPTAVLQVRPTPPPIAKPGSSAAKALSPNKPKPARPKQAESTPLPPGLDDIPAPATGRAISGAAADAKVRFETMRKRAAARGFSRQVPKPDMAPAAAGAGAPDQRSAGSSLASRLRLRSDAVLPARPAFEDEQTRVFDLRSAVDMWDHQTRIFDTKLMGT